MNCRTLREQRGMSQVALAEAMGVTQSHISQVERDARGERDMSYSTLERFSVALEVPVTALIDGVAFAPVSKASALAPAMS